MVFTGKETKHGGGVVGDGRSTGVVSPKLHTGGVPSHLFNAPLHNEIDVRLLRNEMVLTKAQQSKLWKIIDSDFDESSKIENAGAEIKELLSKLREP